MELENKRLTQQDIYTLTAERTGFSLDLVKFVISDIFSNIRASVISPLKWKTSINNFGVFSPKEGKVKFYVNMIEDKIKNGEIENTEYRIKKIGDIKRILALKPSEEIKQ